MVAGSGALASGSDFPTIDIFPRDQDSEEFCGAIFEVIARIVGQTTKQAISEDNILTLSHGRSWSHPTLQHDRPAEFKNMGIEWSQPLSEIADADMSVIPRFVEHLTTEMKRQFFEMLYGTLSETCDEHGQTVSVDPEKGFPAAFLEMLEKIEFSVDRQGNVSLPEMHVGAEMGAKLIAQLEAQPQEFKDQIELVKARKSSDALEREASRKAKFLTTDVDECSES